MEMRILPILFALFVSVHCFSIGGVFDRLWQKTEPHVNHVPKDEYGNPLRGRELLKKMHGGYADVDAIADLIEQQRSKIQQRLELEQKDIEKETVEFVQPDPNARPSITQINSRLGLDEVLIEGDIEMTLEEAKRYFGVSESRSKRQAYQPDWGVYGFPATLWKDGVPYMYDPTLGQEAIDVIERAIKFWETETCVTFHKADPKTSKILPVINFWPGPGCRSRIGRDPFGSQTQNITFGDGCEYYAAGVHEIAHTLGFMHEQSRWDRDNYLRIDMNNVEVNRTHNYNKYEEKENDNYGKQYDYGGIMHYDDKAFALDESKIVMYAKNPDYQMSIGHYPTPRYGDIYEMNKLYSCYDKCKNSGTVCKNEGQPNPKNCAVCQCPEGFGGNDCSERQAPSAGMTCGETLAASDTWQTLKVTKTVGQDLHSVRDDTDPDHCTWHITAPAGKTIQYVVTYVGADINQRIMCKPQCSYGGLTVKGQEKTWIPSGMRFCCEEQLNKTMTTASNLLVLQPWSNYRYTDFTVTYKTDSAELATSTTEIPTTTTEEPSTTTTAEEPVTTTTSEESTTTADETTTTADESTTTSEISTTTAEISTTTVAPPPPGPEVKCSNFGNYMLCTTALSFNDAKTHCESKGAKLLTLHKKGTEKIIQRIFNQRQPDEANMFWIGLHKPAGIDSEYSWVDGSPVDYKNWAKRSPRPTAREECAAYWEPNWVGMRCNWKFPFVCQRK
ncbi:hypothetical protein QR680_016065 [Steinernema hermaphroditum]|uniref:Metalloendopeptidase n=1 Tax=Steinernema hermaphroditum TaxID=289476 RepID=A0AA39HA71_9BILA|nr:hypothetical protein QR680_016065 [Steinernema hermaphroditum]